MALFAGYVWFGIYNVGADDPHTRPMLMLMQTLRARSIHVRAQDLKMPNLEDPQLVLKGAGQYAAMCTGCHLAPGVEDSEIRPGLYPQPPNLSTFRIDPRDAFWVIKHGVKMSAMPAWGLTHDDATIWSMVAFLQKLPNLTPAQYADIVARAPPDEDMEGGHHQGKAEEGHGAGMRGMSMAGAASAAVHDSTGEAGHSHGEAVGKAEATPSLPGFEPKAEPAAEAAADTFRAALQKGDRTAALALLAPGATISEGNETQSREQYAALHLGEDIAFLKDARVQLLSRGSMPMGETAMVASRSDIHTSRDGKPISLQNTEMLTLKKTATGWLITKVEWASQELPQ